MNTKTIKIEGVPLIVPDAEWFHLPYHWINDYHDACGAGVSGSFSERVVPEYILGLKQSIVCFIHDLWQSNCDHTLEEFEQSNIAMRDNMLSLNEVKGGGLLKRIVRVPVIYCWFLAINTKAGMRNFIS